MDNLVRSVSNALGIKPERVTRLLKTRTLRLMKYRGFQYVVIRRDMGDLYEGTLLITKDGWQSYRFIPGYPHIKRVLLLRKAVTTHFIDRVIVEEKMDGHNVRVVKENNEILAITRGGYICPYTTARLRKLYGNDIVNMLETLEPQGMLAGEVVGLENPYTKHYYPEAPDWGFFIFDVWTNGQLLPIAERRRIVEEYGLQNVPQLGEIEKNDVETLYDIIDKLSERKREGLVLKDPYNRVDPLKYTTAYINVNDIRIGMEAPFDEGRHFLFPRILREAFRVLERGGGEEEIGETAKRLGLAILEPFINSIMNYLEHEKIIETFRLVFYEHEDLEEFMKYYLGLGVDVVPVSIERTSDGRIIVEAVKYKRDTMREYKRIFRTGLSPLD